MKRKIGMLAGAMLVTGFMGVAMAQSEPPPPPPGPPGAPPMEGQGPHDWFAMHHEHRMLDQLVVPSDNRNLSAADVKKIAEAFLIWNGNRTWKVGNVSENSDNTVSFSLLSPHGDVIAQFKIDRKNGHITRLT